MKVIPLARVDCYCKTGVSGDLCNISLSLTNICPSAFSACAIFIPTITPVWKLNDNEWKILRAVNKLMAPQINQLNQHRLIFYWTTGIRFTLIPEGTCNCIFETRSKHRIVKSSWKPLEEHLWRTVTDLRINLHLPLAAQINTFTIKRIQRFSAAFNIAANTRSNKSIFSKKIIRLFCKESYWTVCTVFLNTNSNNVLSFMKKSCCNRITARRITVRCTSNFSSVNPHSISVNNCTHPEPGLISIKMSNLFCIKFYNLFEPEEAGFFNRNISRKLYSFPTISFISTFAIHFFRLGCSPVKFIIPFFLIISQFLLLWSSATFSKIFNNLIQISFFIAHFFKSLSAQPWSNRRTALARIDNSNRNIKLFRKFLCKKVTGTRHSAKSLWRSTNPLYTRTQAISLCSFISIWLPANINNLVFFAIKRPVDWNSNHSDSVITRECKILRIRELHSLHRKLRVRLSRAEPDFTNVNICKLNLMFVAFNIHCERTTGFSRTKLNLPVSIFVRLCNRSSASELHNNIWINFSRSVHAVNLVALKNHSRAHNTFDFKYAFHSGYILHGDNR